MPQRTTRALAELAAGLEAVVALLLMAAAAGCGSSSHSTTKPQNDAGVDVARDSGVRADARHDAPRDAHDASPPPACSETDPRHPPVQILAMPDAGEGPFVDSLQKAKESIRVLAYDLGTGGVLTTLVAKASAGVDVHVILDTSEQPFDQPAYDALTDAGAKVEWSSPQFQYMHAKTFVVDGKESIISSGNFVLSQMQRERNFAAIDDDPQDNAVLAALIDADWARQTPDLSCTRLIVSPVNSDARIVSLIKSAKRTLDIESMEFSSVDVQVAVDEVFNAGVAVRVLIADVGFVSENTAAETFLTTYKIPGKTLATPILHVKAVMVDGDRAYFGSENLSYTSLEDNREVGIEVLAANGEDVAAMEAVFESDWNAGSTFGGDAGHDAGSDAGHDAGHDAGSDAGHDAGHDAGGDAGHDAGG